MAVFDAAAYEYSACFTFDLGLSNVKELIVI